MTTNKPEVVAWRWRKPVVNDHGETVGGVWELGGAPAFLSWWTNEPLVRLADYEALQAECDTLVEALALCRHQASYSIGGNEALSRQLARVRNIVNEALAAYRKGGDA